MAERKNDEREKEAEAKAPKRKVQDRPSTVGKSSLKRRAITTPKHPDGQSTRRMSKRIQEQTKEQIPPTDGQNETTATNDLQPRKRVKSNAKKSKSSTNVAQKLPESTKKSKTDSKPRSASKKPPPTGGDVVLPATDLPGVEGEGFEMPYLESAIHCKRYTSAGSKGQTLVFTHGAGGTLDAPAMVNFAAGFTESKPLLYFQGNMNLKSRVKMFNAVVEHESGVQALGGRSMGARAAVMTVAENEDVKALVLVSYPLKDGKGAMRDQILLEMKEDVDVLFISGDRDDMCDLDELNEVRRKMRSKTWLAIVKNSDHGMNIKPKKATIALGKLTGKIAAEWLDDRDATTTSLSIEWDQENDACIEAAWN